MLANRMRLTGGAGLPQGAIILSHMETIPPVDVINNLTLPTTGTVTLNPVKAGFGNGIYCDSTTDGLRLDTALPIQSTQGSDFTIEFWLKMFFVDMSAGLPHLINLYTSGGQVLRAALTRDIPNSRYSISLIMSGTFSTVFSSTFVLSGDLKFFRIYKKNTEWGMIVNGVKEIMYTGAYAGGVIGAGVSPSLQVVSNQNLAQIGIDELLIQKDFGNDSTVVPTAPY